MRMRFFVLLGAKNKQPGRAILGKLIERYVNVPFLCHFRRATEIATTGPYLEIVKYLAIHRDKVDTVFNTLAYFDGVSFAARTQAKCLYSTALMDTSCPPSTV